MTHFTLVFICTVLSHVCNFQIPAAFQTPQFGFNLQCHAIAAAPTDNTKATSCVIDGETGIVTMKAPKDGEFELFLDGTTFDTPPTK